MTHSVRHRCKKCNEHLRVFSDDHKDCYFCNVDFRNVMLFYCRKCAPSLAYKEFRRFLEHLIREAICKCGEEGSREVTEFHIRSAIKDLADGFKINYEEYLMGDKFE